MPATATELQRAIDAMVARMDDRGHIIPVCPRCNKLHRTAAAQAACSMREDN